MIDLLRWMVGLAATLAAILFAVANRAGAPVVWSPVNQPLNVPVFALVLGGAAIGFIIGSLLVWFNGAELRRDRRRQRREIRRLEKQRDAATANIE